MMPPPWLMGQQHSFYPASMFQSSGSPLQTVAPLQTASPLQTDSPQSPGSEGNSASSNTSNRATLISTVSMKENTALPPIDHSTLISPQAVVDKYPKMLKESKIPSLAIRLAKEAFFGKEVMSFCTFRGVGSYHALPDTEVKKLKEFLRNLTCPGIISSRPDFEILWKKCVESIGQCCKNLRKCRLASLELK